MIFEVTLVYALDDRRGEPKHVGHKVFYTNSYIFMVISGNISLMASHVYES